MKKVIILFALLCCMVATACPVFADDAPSGVGRDDVINGTYTDTDSDTEDDTVDDGKDMADAFTDYGGKLPGIIDEVKQGWEDVFSGLAGVLKFLADTIGGIFGILPASYTVYIVMLCLCIAVSAIIKVLTE